MKDTVLDRNFRVMMLKMGYTVNDMRDAYTRVIIITIDDFLKA